MISNEFRMGCETPVTSESFGLGSPSLKDPNDLGDECYCEGWSIPTFLRNQMFDPSMLNICGCFLHANFGQLSFEIAHDGA